MTEQEDTCKHQCGLLKRGPHRGALDSSFYGHNLVEGRILLELKWGENKEPHESIGVCPGTELIPFFSALTRDF